MVDCALHCCKSTTICGAEVESGDSTDYEKVIKPRKVEN